MNKPNILLLMADQLAAPALPAYGHKVVRTPNIDRLAENAAVFENTYCNFPICAPSRFSMLSGRLPHSIDAFDNASEFPASIPTMAHYLKSFGYRTILCGKMHFIGPDQLHGYEERLTTDIYPSDFSWTPNWLEGTDNRPTGVSMRPVVEAGACVRSMQIDYDDEVEHFGIQRLFDLARHDEDRPFFLTLSFTHPHPPFVTGQEHWDRYRHDEIDMPQVAPIPLDKLDGHSRWLYYAHAQHLYSVTDEHVRNARHAYYGMISYIDDKVGRMIKALEDTQLKRDTIVVFIADHGEMMGERGMWYKQTFFEWSARVPLMVSWPQHFAARRIKHCVSLVDLLPTFLDIGSGGDGWAPVDPLHGTSLMNLLTGQSDVKERDVISEYSSEGVCAPSRMVRRGRFKYVYTHELPPVLFDLESDPHELQNLAGRDDAREVENALHARLTEDWNPQQVHDRILASQKRRLFLLRTAGLSDRYPGWTYQPFRDESKRYVRGSGTAGPTGAKARARFPYVEPAPADNAAPE